MNRFCVRGGRILKALTIVAIAIVGVSAAAAGSNSIVRIRSSFNNNDPFDIVYSGGTGPFTELQPGIYAPEGKDLKLIYAGNVTNVGRTFAGILAEFPMTKISSRYESFALVDGKLILFSMKSRAEQVDSVLVFGQNMALTDAVRGSVVPLDPIPTPDDQHVNVVVRQDLNEVGGELFLVSVNQKNINGSGITFVGALKQSENKLELLAEPLVIDYQFRNKEELAKLHGGDFKVLSQEHISNLSRPHAGDDRALKEYRKFAADLAKDLTAGKMIKALAVDPKRLLTAPYLDTVNGGTTLQNFPVKNIWAHMVPISQRLDPAGNNSGVFVGNYSDPVLNDRNRVPDIYGRADVDEKTNQYKILFLYPTTDTHDTLVLISVERRRYLIFWSNLNNRWKNIEVTPFTSDGIFSADAAAFVMSPSVDGGRENYILISSKEDQKNSTVCVKVTETANIVKVSEVIPVSKTYSDASDLLRRSRLEQSGGDLKVLYDNVTKEFPAIPVKDKDGTDVTQTVPFLDLTHSTSKVSKQFYLQPLRQQYLAGQDMTFNYYNPDGAIESKTGIYQATPKELTDLAGQFDQFFQGRVLTKDDLGEQPNRLPTPQEYVKRFSDMTRLLQIAQTFDIPKDSQSRIYQSYSASFVPFMPVLYDTPHALRFQLAMQIAHRRGTLANSHEDKIPVIPALHLIDMPFEISRFKGAQLIQGRRKFANDLVLLVFANARPGTPAGASPEEGGAGMLALPLKIDRAPSNKYDRILLDLKTDYKEWIHSGELSSQNVRDRIIFDADGAPLWIETSTLERTDKNFQLTQIARGHAKIYPNRGISRVAIRWDESIENDKWGLSFSGDNPWLVTGMRELETRFPDYAKHVEEGRKEKEEKEKDKDKDKDKEEKNSKDKKKKVKQAENLFPELRDNLDELSEPGSPNQHIVYLVSDELYDTVRNQMFDLLTDHGGRDHHWHLWNKALKFYVYDPSYDPEETTHLLGSMGRSSSSKSLVYVDLKALVAKEEMEHPHSMNPLAASDAAQAAAGEGADTATKSAKESAHAFMGAAIKTNIEEAANQAQVNLNFGFDGKEKDEDAEHIPFANTRLAFLSQEGDEVNLKNFKSERNVRQMSMITLATPEQWRRMQEQFPEEKAAGVFNAFKVDARFLTASWTVWSPKSSKATKEVKDFGRSAISKDEYSVFGNLETIFNELVDAKATAKHQLLVVPEEIKPLVNRMIMARWATDSKELDGPWSYRNRDLALFSVQQGAVTQETIHDNFESMRGAKSSRHPVLIADMHDLLKIGRPVADQEDNSYKIRDPNAAQNTGGLADDSSENAHLDHAQAPHILWWMATEGRKVQPRNEKGWKLSSVVKTEIPMLIVATEKELQSLDQDVSFESRFVDLKEQFSVVQLEKPTDARKQALLEDLFSRPEIASLQYQFKLNKFDTSEARRQLIGLMIGRVDQIARDQKSESTAAFLKVYSALKRALTEDVELRRNREIDASYLSRLFAKVFPLPLTYDILRKDDKLQKLKVPEEAARRLQEHGYEGSLEFKTRAVRALTSHTNGASDGGRKIPSSLVLIGDSSSGKTFFFETLINVLNLKEYKFDQPYDEDAEAFTLRVLDLLEKEDPSHPEKMTVDKALAHLDNFLCKPNGWRGLILIDDLHKAGNKEILQKIMTRLQSLFEAEGGMIKVKCMKPGKDVVEFKEIPVRNLQIGITINPTNDLDKRKKFFKDWETTKDPVREAVAALSIGDYQVDASLFTRITDVVDLSDFPRDAKVPSLIKKVRDANLQGFFATPRMVAVTPRTLDMLVNTFPNSNARDFLIPATYALLNLPGDMPKAPIYIVDPQDIGMPKKVEEIPDDRPFGPKLAEMKVEPGQIEDTLKRSTVVVGIYPEDPNSKLKLISFLVDNFRGSIYNSLVLSAENSTELGGSQQARATMLFSFLAGVLGNITQQQHVPMSLLQIRPPDLGVTDVNAILDLEEKIKQDRSNNQMPSIRVPVGDHEERINLRSFLGEEPAAAIDRTRMDLMKQTSHDVQEIVERLLSKTLNVSGLNELTDPNRWLMSLTQDEPKAAFKEAGEQLIKAYLKFSAELYDTSLKEMRDRNMMPNMKTYDEVRLFLLCLDSAIAQIRWSYVGEFLLRSVDLASKDLALGQRAGIQHFLFKSSFSPFATTTPDSVLTSVKGISTMKTMDEAKLSRWGKDFQANCNAFLATPKEEAQP